VPRLGEVDAGEETGEVDAVAAATPDGDAADPA